MGVWVEFKTHPAGYMVIPEDIRSLLSRGKGFVDIAKLRQWVNDRCEELLGETPTEMFNLPYPASPVINKLDNPSEAEWTFCYSPNTCKGKHSCPKEHACND